MEEDTATQVNNFTNFSPDERPKLHRESQNVQAMFGHLQDFVEASIEYHVLQCIEQNGEMIMDQVCSNYSLTPTKKHKR